jgi:hypothetical protein
MASDVRAVLLKDLVKSNSFDGILVALESFDKESFRIIARYSKGDHSANKRWDEKEGKMIDGCFLAGYHHQNPEWMITNHSGTYFYFRRKRISFEKFLQRVKETRESDFFWLLFHPEVSSGLIHNLEKNQYYDNVSSS